MPRLRETLAENSENTKHLQKKEKFSHFHPTNYREQCCSLSKLKFGTYKIGMKYETDGACTNLPETKKNICILLTRSPLVLLIYSRGFNFFGWFGGSYCIHTTWKKYYSLRIDFKAKNGIFSYYKRTIFDNKRDINEVITYLREGDDF